jgi:hypothetical protein
MCASKRRAPEWGLQPCRQQHRGLDTGPRTRASFSRRSYSSGYGGVTRRLNLSGLEHEAQAYWATKDRVWRLSARLVMLVGPMPFETRIRELSERLAQCRDDAESLTLIQELQAVLHERIQQLREKVAGLPLLRRSPQQK